MDQATEDLVSSWLTYIGGDRTDTQLGWSFDKLTDMTRSEPAEAWKVIRELVLRAPSAKVLGVIGAGPLEDLLSFNGQLILPLLEKEAPVNDRLREALGHVWKFKMENSVWNRVAALRGSITS